MTSSDEDDDHIGNETFGAMHISDDEDEAVKAVAVHNSEKDMQPQHNARRRRTQRVMSNSNSIVSTPVSSELVYEPMHIQQLKLCAVAKKEWIESGFAAVPQRCVYNANNNPYINPTPL